MHIFSFIRYCQSVSVNLPSYYECSSRFCQEVLIFASPNGHEMVSPWICNILIRLSTSCVFQGNPCPLVFVVLDTLPPSRSPLPLSPSCACFSIQGIEPKISIHAGQALYQRIKLPSPSYAFDTVLCFFCKLPVNMFWPFLLDFYLIDL